MFVLICYIQKDIAFLKVYCSYDHVGMYRICCASFIFLISTALVHYPSFVLYTGFILFL